MRDKWLKLLVTIGTHSSHSERVENTTFLKQTKIAAWWWVLIRYYCNNPCLYIKDALRRSDVHKKMTVSVIYHTLLCACVCLHLVCFNKCKTHSRPGYTILVCILLDWLLCLQRKDRTMLGCLVDRCISNKSELTLSNQVFAQTKHSTATPEQEKPCSLQKSSPWVKKNTSS